LGRAFTNSSFAKVGRLNWLKAWASPKALINNSEKEERDPNSTWGYSNATNRPVNNSIATEFDLSIINLVILEYTKLSYQDILWYLKDLPVRDTIDNSNLLSELPKEIH
jgi:hypothetical protein